MSNSNNKSYDRTSTHHCYSLNSSSFLFRSSVASTNSISVNASPPSRNPVKSFTKWFTRWSFTRPSLKLYVRTRSLRSPEPIRPFRRSALLLCASNRFASKTRARKTLNALSLFLCCERSSWQITTVLVGMCVSRTALFVVFTCCPPAPLARMVSTRTSSSFTKSSEPPSSSRCGNTATEAVEVCTRPCVSVAGTLCTRCTPDSY
mmetsp:Transcript_958/g.3663  ORF Transcript_958/g.3663 Transcript_958/m.3663 type:complete len:205 (+) Transcript_958:3419-4033(+)